MTDDSPYQDAKDAGSKISESVTNLGQAAKHFGQSMKNAGESVGKVEDFASHSTGRVIGPLATKAIEGCKALFQKFFAKDEVKPWTGGDTSVVAPAAGELEGNVEPSEDHPNDVPAQPEIDGLDV